MNESRKTLSDLSENGSLEYERKDGEKPTFYYFVCINHLLILLLKSLEGLNYDQSLLSLCLSCNFSISVFLWPSSGPSIHLHSSISVLLMAALCIHSMSGALCRTVRRPPCRCHQRAAQWQPVG